MSVMLKIVSEDHSCSPTRAEYFGQKFFDIGSEVQEEIGLALGVCTTP